MKYIINKECIYCGNIDSFEVEESNNEIVNDDYICRNCLEEDMYDEKSEIYWEVY